MARPHALLRAGFPYLTSLGFRRMTTSPMDIAIGQGGLLYVLCRSELESMEIKRINWEDEDLGAIGGTGKGDGQFAWPVCIIPDRQGRLYVSDESLHRISTFSPEGEFLCKWGEHGNGDGQLNRPAGIALDAEDNMYVVDSLNHRVQKFTKDGVFLTKFGGHGAGEGQFNMPWGITVEELGDVYVVDWRNDRVQKFTADGEFVFAFGRSGSGNGQFNRPAGIAVDGDGDIYVADRGNNRVQQFDSTGRYLDKFIGDATLGNAARTYMLANPKSLRLREMTSLEPAKRLRSPASVRVDDQRRMYIVDYGSHRIQVYQKEAYPLESDQIMPDPGASTLFTV